MIVTISLFAFLSLPDSVFHPACESIVIAVNAADASDSAKKMRDAIAAERIVVVARLRGYLKTPLVAEKFPEEATGLNSSQEIGILKGVVSEGMAKAIVIAAYQAQGIDSVSLANALKNGQLGRFDGLGVSSPLLVHALFASDPDINKLGQEFATLLYLEHAIKGALTDADVDQKRRWRVMDLRIKSYEEALSPR